MTVIYLILILTGAVIFDLNYDRIPNKYLISGFLFLAVEHFSKVGFNGIGSVILSCFLPIILLFPFFAAGLIGGADIKCLCLIGLSFTTPKVLLILCLALFFGGLTGIVKLIRFGTDRGRFFGLIRYLIDMSMKIRMQGVLALDESYLSRMDKDSVRERGIHFSLPILAAVICVKWGIL